MLLFAYHFDKVWNCLFGLRAWWVITHPTWLPPFNPSHNTPTKNKTVGDQYTVPYHVGLRYRLPNLRHLIYQSYALRIRLTGY